MQEFFLIAIGLLFLLAIADLIVGVSNDAVNFLNSAIGSRAAPRKVILIVASLGIILGATFSSGMMEVARTGIFNPEAYYFSDVMIIFLAVMLTDVILLDFYNTFGLPTSTTVSLVFELLGTAVTVAALKIMATGADWDTLAGYINSAKALTIVTSILLSVGISLVFGVSLMYLSRLLFTFQYERRFRWFGGVWAGLALSAVTYFLLIKGIKGASFVPAAFSAWVKDNGGLLFLGSFLFWSLLMQVLMAFRVNVLQIVVLFGTFSLAMAFAGNDLVNFIGVPLAGYEAFRAWAGTGLDPDGFGMGVLREVENTNTGFLLLAGLVMTLTLWFSRKARTVTETEVNLGRQQEGLERFSPNLLAQGLVRVTIKLGRATRFILPGKWREKIKSRFEAPSSNAPADGAPQEQPAPAFDLIRATVNLTVASALIALGTSFKLPLSTTYVTFMVAMGSSLADRAWGRDSAVYRVAGVVNVIGGWFATAFIAFTVSGAFAFLLYQFRLPALIGLVLLAAGLITRTFILHHRREEVKRKREAAQAANSKMTTEQVASYTARQVAENLHAIGSAFSDALEGLRREDLLLLQQAKAAIKEIRRQNEEFRYSFYNDIRRIEEIHGHGSRAYLLVYDLRQDIVQSIAFIVEACNKHVKNSHRPLENSQSEELERVVVELAGYFGRITEMMSRQDFDLYQEVKAKKKALLLDLERLMAHQVDGIKQKAYNASNSLLYFSLLLETKDMVAVAARFAKLYYRLYQKPHRPGLTLVTEPEGQEAG